MRVMTWCLVATLVGSCGAAAGTHPHEMSAAQHEQAGRADDARADEEAVACGSTGGERGDRPCWSIGSERSAEHRHVAAEHRAAAQALRDAEAQACVGIDEGDRDTSPFQHRDDIASVTRLVDSIPQGDATPIERLAGATVVFRAIRGMSAEWLQRVVDCHLARNSAVGHDMPEMPGCPLVPAGASARVRSTGDGFAVDIRAENDASAAEILRRAETLLPGSGRGMTRAP